ncbi:MAG: hypothetical protein P4M12_07760, partial [Gammaproteobacteria bacterium]|nr:hypothetical protein [Gammaproteobacteria bacterium]
MSKSRANARLLAAKQAKQTATQKTDSAAAAKQKAEQEKIAKKAEQAAKEKAEQTAKRAAAQTASSSSTSRTTDPHKDQIKNAKDTLEGIKKFESIDSSLLDHKVEAFLKQAAELPILVDQEKFLPLIEDKEVLNNANKKLEKYAEVFSELRKAVETTLKGAVKNRSRIEQLQQSLNEVTLGNQFKYINTFVHKLNDSTNKAAPVIQQPESSPSPESAAAVHPASSLPPRTGEFIRQQTEALQNAAAATQEKLDAARMANTKQPRGRISDETRAMFENNSAAASSSSPKKPQDKTPTTKSKPDIQDKLLKGIIKEFDIALQPPIHAGSQVGYMVLTTDQARFNTVLVTQGKLLKPEIFENKNINDLKQAQEVLTHFKKQHEDLHTQLTQATIDFKSGTGLKAVTKALKMYNDNKHKIGTVQKAIDNIDNIIKKHEDKVAAEMAALREAAEKARAVRLEATKKIPEDAKHTASARAEDARAALEKEKKAAEEAKQLAEKAEKIESKINNFNYDTNTLKERIDFIKKLMPDKKLLSDQVKRIGDPVYTYEESKQLYETMKKSFGSLQEKISKCQNDLADYAEIKTIFEEQVKTLSAKDHPPLTKEQEKKLDDLNSSLSTLASLESSLASSQRDFKWKNDSLDNAKKIQDARLLARTNENPIQAKLEELKSKSAQFIKDNENAVKSLDDKKRKIENALYNEFNSLNKDSDLDTIRATNIMMLNNLKQESENHKINLNGQEESLKELSTEIYNLCNDFTGSAFKDTFKTNLDTIGEKLKTWKDIDKAIAETEFIYLSKLDDKIESRNRLHTQIVYETDVEEVKTSEHINQPEQKEEMEEDYEEEFTHNPDDIEFESDPRLQEAKALEANAGLRKKLSDIKTEINNGTFFKPDNDKIKAKLLDKIESSKAFITRAENRLLNGKGSASPEELIRQIEKTQKEIAKAIYEIRAGVINNEPLARALANLEHSKYFPNLGAAQQAENVTTPSDSKEEQEAQEAAANTTPSSAATSSTQPAGGDDALGVLLVEIIKGYEKNAVTIKFFYPEPFVADLKHRLTENHAQFANLLAAILYSEGDKRKADQLDIVAAQIANGEIDLNQIPSSFKDKYKDLFKDLAAQQAAVISLPESDEEHAAEEQKQEAARLAAEEAAITDELSEHDVDDISESLIPSDKDHEAVDITPNPNSVSPTPVMQFSELDDLENQDRAEEDINRGESKDATISPTSQHDEEELKEESIDSEKSYEDDEALITPNPNLANPTPIMQFSELDDLENQDKAEKDINRGESKDATISPTSQHDEEELKEESIDSE